VAAPADLAEFCRREHPRVVGALSLYCGDRLLAEELAQEALERACARWGEVSGMTAPGAWVHRVAINLARSRFRRRRAERRANARSHSSIDSYDDGDIAAAVAVRERLAALPERQRAVLVLRFYLGHSVAETATVLGLSGSAVAALTHRAVVAMRADLGVDGDQEVRRVR
jgi:RNA polymerase sigma-70 factor (ECF subfamily)